MVWGGMDFMRRGAFICAGHEGQASMSVLTRPVRLCMCVYLCAISDMASVLYNTQTLTQTLQRLGVRDLKLKWGLNWLNRYINKQYFKICKFRKINNNINIMTPRVFKIEIHSWMLWVAFGNVFGATLCAAWINSLAYTFTIINQYKYAFWLNDPTISISVRWPTAAKFATVRVKFINLCHS